MRSIKTPTLVTVALTLALAAVAGCQCVKPDADDFPPEGATRSIHHFADAQAAAAARADATLSAVHFDGEQLNALGEQKLASVLKAESAAPLTLYMDTPETDATAEGRRRAVALFLKDRNVPESHIHFVSGANPDGGWSADAALRRRALNDPAAGASDGAATPAGSLKSADSK